MTRPEPAPDARRRRALVVLLLAYLAAVGMLTLRDAPAGEPTFDVVRALVAWCAEHGVPLTYDRLEAGSNVVMFVPFGVLVGALLPAGRRGLAVPLGLATSAAIETYQGLLLPTRYATVQDVVVNTAGAALGWAALLVVLRLRRRSGRRSAAPA